MSVSEQVDIDAIVVAHNSGELLLDAVRSLTHCLPSDHVNVVDTESDDGSIEVMRAVEPDVRVHSVSNSGFAAANNTGIRETSRDYVLLLNPDAELQPDALENLVRTMSQHDDLGVVGGLILNDDGTVQDGAWGRFPSLLTVLRLAMARMWAGATGRRYAPTVPQSTFDIDWVTGAMMFVRRSAIEQAGLMDEGYFLYYEDVDWCFAIRSAGWRVMVDPTVRVVHRSGSSGAGESEIGKRAYRESFWRYCDKHGLWGLKLAARVGLRLRGWRRTP